MHVRQSDRRAFFIDKAIGVVDGGIRERVRAKRLFMPGGTYASSHTTP